LATSVKYDSAGTPISGSRFATAACLTSYDAHARGLVGNGNEEKACFLNYLRRYVLLCHINRPFRIVFV
jgi:hypothetical protein